MTQDLSGLHYETQESQNKIITDLGLSTSVIIHLHFSGSSCTVMLLVSFEK